MSKTTFRIVAAVDFDDTATPTWSTALSLLENPHAELSLLHVVPVGERDVRKDPDAAAATIQQGLQRMQELLGRQLGSDSPLCARIDLHVGLGDPAEEIVQLAIDHEADLIVVGTREKNRLERLVLGSVSSRVFRSAPCSVLVARPADYAGTEKSASIDAPLAAGQSPMIRAAAPVRYRSLPFSSYNANLFPTGIPRKTVR